jgi:hypothetical protein
MQSALIPIINITALILVFLFFSISIYLAFSIKQDNAILDKFLANLKITTTNSGEFIEKLNHFVYLEKGFAKNKHYFLFKKLGATPVQVLQHGGDCADKSRLLSALLKRLNIDSTLLMLYGCETCGPTHTTVNARYDQGWMTADPVFDIVFPKSDNSYYDVID